MTRENISNSAQREAKTLKWGNVTLTKTLGIKLNQSGKQHFAAEKFI